MRGISTLLGATAITAIAFAAPFAIATTTATAATPTLKLTNTSLGEILTSGGDTLYAFTRDTPNVDTCVSIKGCIAIWRPLITTGTPKAGPGVNASLIGTITGRGKMQATYNQWPLYIYTVQPTGIGYVGAKEFGGNWDALNAMGVLVP